MMALTQENVHYTLNSGPGLMNRQVEQGSCADPGIFVRRMGGGGGGGGGVEAPTASKQSGQCFFSNQLILQFTEWIQRFYYRGEDAWGPTSSRGWGCPKKPIYLVIFQGVRTP